MGATIAVLSFLLSDVQSLRQEEREIARASAEASFKSTVEANRIIAESLEAYIDDLTSILIQADLQDESVRATVRFGTVSILNQLDASQNDKILDFLHEADLYEWVLRFAELSGADLKDASLFNADLIGADLSYADLSGASLGRADLVGSYLAHANLKGAGFINADLRWADFTKADMSTAIIDEADFKFAVYDEATLWPNGFDPQQAGAVLEE